MQLDDVITTVKGRRITVADTLTFLKCSGAFRAAIYELIKSHVLAINADEYGINLSETEIAGKLDEKRRLSGLDDPEKFHGFLRSNGITIDDWRNQVVCELYKDKLLHFVVSDDAVQNYFNQHKHEFEKVLLGRIVCNAKNDIEHVKGELGQGVSFSELAYKYSKDRHVQCTGGFMGEVPKGVLSPAIQTAIFNARKNDIAGPFEESGFWTIYKIYDVIPAKLDEPLKKWISGRIFAQWVRDKVHSAPA